ncbi:MAG: hypothetical protein H6933_08385 [Burkholderiaceae bacterium]|nr:hypothetical protein [Burkholderiaceae bacterium]
MVDTRPLIALVASIAAPAALAADAFGDAERQSHESRARQALRMAQVELYCDHDARAYTALQLARRELQAASGAAAGQGLASLDRAVWQMRHHDTRGAVAALDDAIEGLPPRA